MAEAEPTVKPSGMTVADVIRATERLTKTDMSREFVLSAVLHQLHALRARLAAREQSLSKSLEQTRVFGVLGDDDCLRIRLEDVRAILGEAENEYTECYCPLCDLVVPASEESKHQHTSEVRAILGKADAQEGETGEIPHCD